MAEEMAEEPAASPTPSRFRAQLSSLSPKATPGVLAAASGALLSFLAAFLTWATVEVSSRTGDAALVGGGTRSVSGLQGDRLGKATLVVAVAALLLAGLMLAPASRRWAWIVLAVCGGLILMLGLIDLVAISDSSDVRQRLALVPGCSGPVRCRGERHAGIGVWLTLLGGAAVVIGAFLHAGLLPGPLRGFRPPGRRPSAPPIGF